MSILVTGAAGQLGSELVRRLGEAANACDSAQLDITNTGQVMEVVGSARPQAVINCAAYTKVDLAEQEKDACYAVNATGVANLAEACQRVNSTLVQLSTDYVFGADVERTAPYRETDDTHAQSVYAQSKLQAEDNARGCPRHFVVRTCGLYGMSATGNNFVETMLRLGNPAKTLRIVDDQVCTPSYTAHVAAAILRLVKTEAFGTYHIVNFGATTWHDFAREIFEQAGLDVQLEAITTEEFGAAAARPRYSVLDTSKYEQATGHTLANWQTGLREYLSAKTLIG
ncbi:MAG: dTDP-4-dehydrorhamnose reductase [Bythopirellula sp.]